ncbi:MAG: hypothetical protein ASARMPRED_001095 [Alectoria sarmentosa]|nr:MAG: hypothetical protein ASARMPRED_001095 [Alectoria sarmentosa]
MAFSHLNFDPPGKDVPSHGYSSGFVSKALARLVNPIDPNDPEQYPADLTITCGSLRVDAHSHVLCENSSYFKVEEQTQELKLPADEEFLIRRLLCYRYTTGYNDEPYDDEKTPPPHIEAPAYINRLHLNAQMYSTGDKYDIPSLKEKAAEKFEATIREIHADQKMNPGTGASLVDEIIEAIPHIYSSTPDRDRRLRDRVVQVACHKRKEFKNHPALRDLRAAAPEFFEDRGVRFLSSLWN